MTVAKLFPGNKVIFRLLLRNNEFLGIPIQKDVQEDAGLPHINNCRISVDYFRISALITSKLFIQTRLKVE